jgi:hypothetical protein
MHAHKGELVTNQSDEWIPITEAAMMLGIGRERLLRRLQSGKIKGRIDARRPTGHGRYFIKRSTIEQELAQREIQPA